MTLQICELSRLACLDLSDNSLSDELPPCLGNLTMLKALDLQGNRFRGPIPPELRTSKRLVQLILGDNNLDGTIPSSKGNLSNLTYLQIPIEFGCLIELRHLDLHNNPLSGAIPGSLIQHLHLKSINLSYNLFTGPISNCLVTAYSRDAFLGNKGLYIVKDRPPSRSDPTKIVLISAIFPEFITVPSSCFLLRRFPLRRRMKSDEAKETPEKDGDFMSIWNYDGKIAYECIDKVTEDFDIKYCIGTGGYASVYRAELPNGKTVALEKLHCFEVEDPSSDKNFRNKVKHSTRVRHRSIIRLYGFCLHR
ncbi:MDIS1-interacting receptor like kinase 2-like [Eucalyptus grandis]|uniref:MDIS1-interacting receptor like kinase 2-like n=1 Tax=Eucalyptus grandis TaxID=71139 RepID=UPI00192E9126|nr:MDIS1-interacting receptor like kinase 2-like [Eucalyptus grandis]